MLPILFSSRIASPFFMFWKCITKWITPPWTPSMELRQKKLVSGFMITLSCSFNERYLPARSKWNPIDCAISVIGILLICSISAFERASSYFIISPSFLIFGCQLFVCNLQFLIWYMKQNQKKLGKGVNRLACKEANSFVHCCIHYLTSQLKFASLCRMFLLPAVTV